MKNAKSKEQIIATIMKKIEADIRQTAYEVYHCDRFGFVQNENKISINAKLTS